MPTTIACPGCSRALTLPDEHMNRPVQCPACRHSFHPAEAAPAAAIRPAVATPKLESIPARSEAPAPVPTPPRPPARPPIPPPELEPRRASRRRKREENDLCPKCHGLVPRTADKCPECGAELEPESESDYRPWEQTGQERRDSEPHRGTWLLWGGIISIFISFGFMCPVVGFIATALGIGLSIWVIVAARKDMRKMDQQSMDRTGRGSTQAGMICSIIGLVFNGLAAIPAGIIAVQQLLN
ncbi:MAG TPA: hypothetical protein VGZ47_00905 [Gemmataceae bacterium]|jgi:hypothetical protein|nr:hypothetical protein [Gemmataceae bacterium]